MLPSISPFRVGEPACLYFWQLPISKQFTLPQYYIGQVVLHQIKRPNGEILHPVVVIGISWTGSDWQYGVQFPEDHPQYQPGDIEADWVDEWQIEEAN